jgi:virulence factor Mce-like protein
VNTARLKLEVERARNPFLWLVFALMAAIITLVLIFNNLTFLKPFEKRYTVNVAFDSVKGVFAGQHPVRIAGVKVGFVQALRTVDGEGVATLSLVPRYGPLYKDAQLRIRPQTPLQDMYVTVVDRGTPAAGAIPSGSSQVISSKQTETPVDISRVLDTFDEDTRTHLNTLLHELATGLAGNGQDLKAAFAEVAPFLHAAQDVTTVMADRQTELKRVITNFGNVADLLAERDAQLNTLITAGNSTLTSLSSASSPLSETVRQFPPTMTALRDSFTSLRAAEDEMDPALRQLVPAAHELDNGLNGLKQFSDDATPALRDLQPAFNQLQPLSQELKPTTDSLESAFTQLRPQAPRFDGITQTAMPCLDTSLSKFFQDTLSVLKFSDAYGAIPRGALTQGSTGFESIADPGLKHVTPCYAQGEDGK